MNERVYDVKPYVKIKTDVELGKTSKDELIKHIHKLECMYNEAVDFNITQAKLIEELSNASYSGQVFRDDNL